MGKALCRKCYVDCDGVTHKSPVGNWDSVAFEFINGHVVEVKRTDLNDGIIAIAAAHGLAQKIGDSYANAEGDVNVAEAMAQDMVNRLCEGTWNIVREGGAAATLMAQALAEATGESLAECIAKIGDMSKEDKAALRKHPQMAGILARMEAERAQAKAERLAAEAANAAPLVI